jgi:hypothetical protein
MKLVSHYHFLQQKAKHRQNANTRYNSIKLSRANSRIRWLNSDYTNASRTTLRSRHLWGEELYNFDVSPLHIHTCLNPWLTDGGGLEQGFGQVYSIYDTDW